MFTTGTYCATAINATNAVTPRIERLAQKDVEDGAYDQVYLPKSDSGNE